MNILKMDDWKTSFLVGRPIFRGELLVLGRVSFCCSILAPRHLSDQVLGSTVIDLQAFREWVLMGIAGASHRSDIRHLRSKGTFI